jgi:perosamine synthetase
VFIEDACEGLLGTYEGIPAGSSASSLCSAVSFFANKTITSGEGGAFFTHDKDVYDYVYRSIHHGLSDERYVYHTPGYNYRMTNLQAALLYDQLLHLDEIVSDKRSLFEEYKSLLKDCVVYPMMEEGTEPAPWMFVCGVRGIEYPELDRQLRDNGIDVRPFFYDIHRHDHLADIPASTLSTSATFFMIPSHPDLSKADAERISNAICCLS